MEMRLLGEVGRAIPILVGRIRNFVVQNYINQQLVLIVKLFIGLSPSNLKGERKGFDDGEGRKGACRNFAYIRK